MRWTMKAKEGEGMQNPSEGRMGMSYLRGFSSDRDGLVGCDLKESVWCPEAASRYLCCAAGTKREMGRAERLFRINRLMEKSNDPGVERLRYNSRSADSARM